MTAFRFVCRRDRNHLRIFSRRGHDFLEAFARFPVVCFRFVCRNRRLLHRLGNDVPALAAGRPSNYART